MTDLIRLLCGLRDENYPYERTLGLITFTAWLHFPRHPRQVEGARAVAAATMLAPASNEKVNWKFDAAQKQQFASATFNIAQVAPYLRDPPLDGQYSDYYWTDAEFQRIEALNSIAAFLLRCPPSENAGINKAFDFIEADGFGFGEKISRPTLNRYWSAMAEVSPFIIAMTMLEIEWIRELAPDEPDSLNRALKFLPKRASELFGLAKRLQTEMLNRMHVISKRNVESRFVTFPTEIKITKHVLPPLDSVDVEFVRKYKERREAALQQQIDRSVAREIRLSGAK